MARENRIKTIWARGGVPRNVFLGIPDGFAAEIIASTGWDAVTIDMQHGLIDYAAAVRMMQAMSRYDGTPMVRVPWNDPAMIMKSLDAGALGIICPMVNNRAEAEQFVGACKYAPEGYRSTGPVRAVYYAGTDYHDRSGDLIATFAMVETVEALANLDEIATTPGLDALYIGPSDLSVSLGGKPGPDPTDRKVVEAVDSILAAAKRHGIKAAMHTMRPEYATSMIEKGFDLVTVSSDHRFMATGAAEALAAVKGG